MTAADLHPTVPPPAGADRARRPRALRPAGAALAALLAAATFAGEPAAPPRAMAPEFEVTVADAGQARAIFKKNAWFKEFAASNLYRGTMVRLGPALFAVGRGDKDGWKGRLGDFLLDRVLAGRPMRISYFSVPSLVSPFGVTVAGLSSAERSVLHAIVGSRRSGDDVPTAVAAGDSTVTVNVTPVSVGMQRFAVVETASSIAISRDPDVAAALGARAAEAKPASAAVLDVDVAQFFSSWSVLLEKRFGVGGTLRVSFDYESGGARYVPAKAELPLRPDHLISSAELPPAVLGAIPADALFFATVSIPDPGPLSPDSVAEYLSAEPGASRAPAVPVTLLYLGVQADEKRNTEPLSAILVPAAGVDDDAEQGVQELFNRRGRYEVGTSTACKGLLAISPSQDALARINEACAGRRPSFRQAPPKLVGAFSGRPVGAAAFLNVGSYLSSALRLGWQLKGAAPEKAPPPEIADALALLDRLPMMGFSGAAAGETLVMRGVEP